MAAVIGGFIGFVAWKGSQKPKCDKCGVSADYDEDWGRWYCPKCDGGVR